MLCVRRDRRAAIHRPRRVRRREFGERSEQPDVAGVEHERAGLCTLDVRAVNEFGEEPRECRSRIGHLHDTIMTPRLAEQRNQCRLPERRHPSLSLTLEISTPQARSAFRPSFCSQDTPADGRDILRPTRLD